MRIGIDARFYGTIGKGLGRYTEKLIEHLEAIDTENDYVVFLRRENFDEYAPKNPRFRKKLAHYQWYSFAEQLLFPRLLSRFRFDLVHFPHFNVPIFYRKKFVVTIHDLILLHYPTLRNTTRGAILYGIKFAVYRLVIASAVRRAAQIIAVSHFTREDILKQYPEARGKISVTYEAADPVCRFFPPGEERALFGRLGLIRNGAEERIGGKMHDILKPYFLYVGNAYPHKNLEALTLAARGFPEHCFVLVGKEDYFYARLKEEARRRGAKNIIFAGFLTDRELNSLYRFATLYVFPSLYEGFGLPPLEAMTCGLPVVSSDRASLPEILGEAAAYFDPEQEGSLEKVLAELAADTEKRAALRERGYAQAARFRWRDMALATQVLYRQALENKK